MTDTVTKIIILWCNKMKIALKSCWPIEDEMFQTLFAQLLRGLFQHAVKCASVFNILQNKHTDTSPAWKHDSPTQKNRPHRSTLQRSFTVLPTPKLSGLVRLNGQCCGWKSGWQTKKKTGQTLLTAIGTAMAIPQRHKPHTAAAVALYVTDRAGIQPKP